MTSETTRLGDKETWGEISNFEKRIAENQRRASGYPNINIQIEMSRKMN
jgi:hypothetical protein